jgi:hypothetical protein
MIKNKEYYKKQFRMAVEEIARLQAIIYSLREDFRNLLDKKKEN